MTPNRSRVATSRTITVFDELTLKPITVMIEVLSNFRFLTMSITDEANHPVNKMQISAADATKIAGLLSQTEWFPSRDI